MQRERYRAGGDAVSSAFSTEETLLGVPALAWTPWKVVGSCFAERVERRGAILRSCRPCSIGWFHGVQASIVKASIVQASIVQASVIQASVIQASIV
ncbi:MAG TPA: hypothetical protein VK678_04635, partial [Bradyrhizobium sp.]|nr:hypothetical protein [Bradyrhizobium sp.]